MGHNTSKPGICCLLAGLGCRVHQPGCSNISWESRKAELKLDYFPRLQLESAVTVIASRIWVNIAVVNNCEILLLKIDLSQARVIIYVNIFIFMNAS